eukprot:5648153-Prymnesium_polylepis.1
MSFQPGQSSCLFPARASDSHQLPNQACTHTAAALALLHGMQPGPPSTQCHMRCLVRADPRRMIAYHTRLNGHSLLRCTRSPSLVTWQAAGRTRWQQCQERCRSDCRVASCGRGVPNAAPRTHTRAKAAAEGPLLPPQPAQLRIGRCHAARRRAGSHRAAVRCRRVCCLNRRAIPSTTAPQAPRR